ncbi:MAG: Crp/Fnr family transcriptional regulator [Clostridia bacterium]|nr:Crp/Fnr family transcriptional regulator [Clostridia bacterium]
MKDIYNKIVDCQLFNGVSDIERLLSNFDVIIKKYNKDEEIIGYGDNVKILIVISGSLLTVSEDWQGNRNVISHIGKSGIFGVAHVFSNSRSTARVVCESDAEVAIIGIQKAYQDFLSQDYGKFIHNALLIVSNNCISFLEKVEHLSRRSMREKIISYLQACRSKQSSDEFELSFLRQDMADYLAVDRSALSAELSKMKKEGLIDYKKSWFKIKFNGLIK